MLSFQFTENAVETWPWLVVWLQPHSTASMEMTLKISMLTPLTPLPPVFSLAPPLPFSPPFYFLNIYIPLMSVRSSPLRTLCSASQGRAGIEDKHDAATVNRYCSAKQVVSYHSGVCWWWKMSPFLLKPEWYSIYTVKKNLTYIVRWHYSGIAQ